MMKLLSAGALMLVLAACGNSGSETGDANSDSAVTQYRGIENVNGNIPDTAATGAEPNINYHSDSVK